MKKLLLFCIFSGSLDCFCQNSPTIDSIINKCCKGIGITCESNYDTTYRLKDSVFIYGSPIDPSGGRVITYKPDTLSAYLLVTTKRMGIAYQKLGFVVRRYGKEDYFLDCKKQVILPPFNVWSFKIIK